MAWFQNLADHAEDLLNKIDQNAATVLNDSNKLMDEEKHMSEIINLEHNIHQTIVKDSFTIENDKDYKTQEVILRNNDEEPITTDIDGSVQNQIDDDYEKTFKSDGQSLTSHNSFSSEVLHDNKEINKLEMEVQSLNEQLLNLHHLYSQLQNENTNLQSQVETAHYLMSNAQSEMNVYKARTQRILQEKENLISLKSQSNVENSDNINHYDEFTKEIKFQQLKCVELMESVKNLTEENLFLQKQIHLTQNISQQSIQSLQENLKSEKQIRIVAEEECRVKNNELQLKIEEVAQQHHIIQLKNKEINTLQDTLKKKAYFKIGNDFELQIKSLMDTLMMKQSTIEALIVERNGLRLQLEKVENEQLEKAAQVRVINVNNTDDIKSELPHFMTVSPFNAGVTRRVKHVYSTVDAISVKSGLFLRRYPVARVLVFCYMVLLHFWALILLFLYVPTNR